MMKRRFFGYAAGAALFLLFLFSSADARQGAADGLRLWGTLLVPSLLPYFAAAGLLTRLGAADALARRLAPAAAHALRRERRRRGIVPARSLRRIPARAASIGTLYRDGSLRKNEAEHLLAFCDNSGPAFAVGALGVGVFGSAGWGMLLWGIHAISAAAVGILFRRKTRGGEAPIKPPRKTPDFGAALGGAVTAAGQTILQIGAYVIFFSALIASLGALGFPDTLGGELSLCTGGPLSFFRALFTGALELSSGVGAMAGLPLRRKPCAGRISAELGRAVRPRTGWSCPPKG